VPKHGGFLVNSERSAISEVGTFPSRPRVVILGGGFAGSSAALALRGVDAEVILIDRRNHHIFQPLLYQVAAAVLSPAEIAAPIRHLRQRCPNLTVWMAEVTNVDLSNEALTLSASNLPDRTLRFDYLVVAAGVHPTYFGHDEFAPFAPGLKSIADAEAIRSKLLSAYEFAEQCTDPVARARALTFVLVGAGPTGVELAASIAQMARITLKKSFSRIDPSETKIVLLEGAPRVLGSFHPSLSERAKAQLEKLGVEVRTDTIVQSVDANGVTLPGGRLESSTVLWTAGVQGASILASLESKADRAGRILVEPTLNLERYPNVYVVGDAAVFMQDGKPVPGVAQAALQQGAYAGQSIAAQIVGEPLTHPFRYHDRGNMAVVGKNFAIIERGSLRSSGALVWWIWAALHVLFLPQLQNRMRVFTQWLWSYLTGQRSSRIIDEYPPDQRSGEAVSTTAARPERTP